MEDRPKQSRGLEEISHFFLSCQSPSDQATKLTEKEVLDDTGENTFLPNDIVGDEGRQEEVCTAPLKHNLALLFSSSNSQIAEKSFLACNLALELAKRDFSVALVETTTRLPNTFLLFGGYKNINAVFWEKDLNSADFFTILNRLNSKSDVLIMNVSSDILGLGKMSFLVNAFFIVSTIARSEELLDSYLLIKQMSQKVSCREIGLLIMEEDSPRKAEAAFRVITEMAQKFLSCKIRFMGSIPKKTDLFQAILSRSPLRPQGENPPICRSIRKLADSLIQKKYIH
ncbi:MAG: hypothetical protein HWN68_04980 [Desulfobacterales bacterium]|nr:hypothetical protein [Desulfobacterales bacterium]